MNILITGGASGLGAAILRKLAEENKNLIYFTYAKAADAAKKAEATHANVKAIYCNFLDKQSVKDLTDNIGDMNLDVLINNAGTSIHEEHFYKTDPDIFFQSFSDNIIPTLEITQAALKVFRKKKYGKIINIISSAIINTPPVGWSSYVANKAYLLAMSKSWVTENSRFNISINNISPAFMQTGLTAETDERIVEKLKENHPLKELLNTDEVADVVLFFVKASQQINGANLIINAGSDLA
jgi:3-oxoacyl-[acyl-carrier protein] reductase